MRPTILLLVTIFYYCEAGAQEKKQGVARRLEYISVSLTNSHIEMPYGSFSRLFYEKFHPGAEIGTGFNWHSKSRHDLVQTLRLGYTYHRFVQHTLMLYTELGYRYKLPLAMSAIAKIGGGYLHSKEDSKVFVLGDDGEYRTTGKFGRPHGMASFSLGVSKELNKNGWQVFMDYQQRFEFSFIDAYVPALPANVLSIGISLPLYKK